MNTKASDLQSDWNLGQSNLDFLPENILESVEKEKYKVTSKDIDFLSSMAVSKGTSVFVRRAAIRLLGGIGEAMAELRPSLVPQVVKTMEDLLESDSATIRLGATEALWGIADLHEAGKAAVSKLEKAMETEQNEITRKTMGHVLEVLRRNSGKR